MKTHPILQENPVLLSLCAGILSVLLGIFPLHLGVFSFLITYFSALPLYFVGLTYGFSHLALASFCAFCGFTIHAGLTGSFVFFGVTIFPALLLIFRVQKGDTLGHILSWFTGLSIAIFLIFIFIFSPQSIQVLENLQTTMGSFTKDPAFQNIKIQQIMHLLPALSSISWILMSLINALCAQRLTNVFQLKQRIFFHTDGFVPSKNWDIIFIAGLLFTLTKIPLLDLIGKNIILMSGIPIFLVGLKIVYTWLKQFKNEKRWMFGIIFLSIFLVWPMIIIVILGVLEPTLHLYNRLASNEKAGT